MYNLTPTTFDGTNVNDGATYESWFARPDDPLRLVTREPVEVEGVGDYAFPTAPRSQPQSRVLPLHVRILTDTQTTLDNLKKLFDPFKGDLILKAQDGGTPTTYRLTVRTIDVVGDPDNPHLFVARLHVAKPIWEADSESSDEETVTASGQTWTVSNGGTMRCYPTFVIKPTVAASHAAKYLRRYQVIVAWRSELPGVSTNGLPYQTEFGEDAIDLSALNGAGQLQADGDDLRVLVDGVAIDRYIKTDLTDDYIWGGVTFQPMRRLTLKNAMSDVSPADGEDIEIDEPEGTLGWDDAGWILVVDADGSDHECVQYKGRDATHLKDIVRGARKTTAAAHPVADLIYWVEHEIVILIDNEAAANPPAADDRKPVIDLVSTNALHKYPGPLTAPTTLRPGQFLRRHTDDNLLSAFISFLEGGTDAKFRDVAPSAAAPRFNNLELVAPCGVKAAADAISHDVAVQDILGLAVRAVDMEGYRTLLETYHSGNDGDAKKLQPAAVLSRLIYRAGFAAITGAWTADASDLILTQAPRYQQFTLDDLSNVYRMLVRVKKDGTPAGNLKAYLLTDDEDNPGIVLSQEASLALAGVTGSYADYVLEFPTEPKYLALLADKYWLAVRRDDSTGGGNNLLYWSLAEIKVYPKGTVGGSGEGPQGPRDGTVFASDGTIGVVAWVDPGNAAASDNAYATAVLSGGQGSEYLKVTGFGFSIPTTATIKGIVVEWEVKASGTHIWDYVHRLIKAGAYVGDSKIKSAAGDYWPVADEYREYGSPDDLWGTTWTPAEINAADFGVGYSAGKAGVGAETASIDHGRITVYYDLGGLPAQQSTRFMILGGPETVPQPEVPTGSTHEITLDDIDITLDDATPRTPKIVVAAQETIYHLTGTIKNDDTGQELTLSIPLTINSPTLTIDCEAHTVVRSDTGESVPGVVTPSDLVEWMRLDPGTVNLRYTEAGIGTVVITTTHRNPWA